jgi:hypothetical protein
VLYISVGSFAVACLVSLLGSVFVVLQHETMRYAAQVVALGIGVIGVGGLMTASILIVLETRKTLRFLDGTGSSCWRVTKTARMLEMKGLSYCIGANSTAAG